MFVWKAVFGYIGVRDANEDNTFIVATGINRNYTGYENVKFETLETDSNMWYDTNVSWWKTNAHWFVATIGNLLLQKAKKVKHRIQSVAWL